MLRNNDIHCITNEAYLNILVLDRYNFLLASLEFVKFCQQTMITLVIRKNKLVKTEKCTYK